MQLSFKQPEGMDFIAEEKDITNQKLWFYKALCSKENKLLQDLFDQVAKLQKFPAVIADNLINLLGGEIESLVEIVYLSTKGEQYIAKMKRGEKVTAKQEQSQQAFLDFLVNFSFIVNGSNIEDSEYFNFFSQIKIPEDSIRHLQGFSSVLSGNYMQSLVIFDTKPLQHVTMELADSLISIAIKRWDMVDVKVLVKNFIAQYDLYASMSTHQALRYLYQEGHIWFIKDILHLFENDVAPLGRVLDHLVFRNESSLFTMLVAVCTGKLDLEISYDEQKVKAYKKKILRETVRVFDQLFTLTMDDRFYEVFFKD